MSNTSSMSASKINQDYAILEKTVANLRNAGEEKLLRIISEMTKENATLRESGGRKDIEIYELTGQVVDVKEKNAKLVAKNDRRKTKTRKLKRRAEAWKAEKQRFAEMEEENTKLKAKNDRRKTKNRELKKGAEAWKAEKQAFVETVGELRNENEELRTENQQLKDEIAPPTATPAISEADDGFVEGLVYESNDDGGTEEEDEEENMASTSETVEEMSEAVDGLAEVLIYEEDDDEEARMRDKKEKIKAQRRALRAYRSLYIDMVLPRDQPTAKRPRFNNYRIE